MESRILWVPTDPKWHNFLQLVPKPFFNCDYLGIEIAPFQNNIPKFLLDTEYFPASVYKILKVTGPFGGKSTFDISSDEDCRLDINFYAHMLSLKMKKKEENKSFFIGDLLYFMMNRKLNNPAFSAFTAVRLPVPFNAFSDISKNIKPFYPDVLDAVRRLYGDYHNFYNLFCVVNKKSFTFEDVGDNWESAYYSLARSSH